MNTACAIKTGMAWTTIVCIICYLAVGLIATRFRDGERPCPYELEASGAYLYDGNCIAGLISWNLIVASGIALAGLLSCYIRDLINGSDGTAGQRRPGSGDATVD
jgi:hypothetical protein